MPLRGLEGASGPCHAPPVAQNSSLAARFVAVFVAGSAAGAVGIGWIDSVIERADERAEARERAAKRARARFAASPSADSRSGSGTGAPEGVDREALRAALLELLAEERAASGAAKVGNEESAGVSAADVLASLERSYRAELEAKERDGALAVALVDELPVSAAGTPPTEDAADGDEELARGETPPEVVQAAPSKQAALRPSGVPSSEHAALQPAESGPVSAEPAAAGTGEPPEPVRIGSMTVHQGDVNHVDARQLSVVNQYQQFQSVFWYAPPAVPSQAAPRTTTSTSGRSPLSQPLPSAHDQSPWSPVDYSKHHNPWGSTFGRRVP